MSGQCSHKELLASASVHMKTFPAIFTKIRKPVNGQSYSAKVDVMILNLVECFPALGKNSLSKLLGVSEKHIRNVRRAATAIEDLDEAFDDEKEERDERAVNIAGDQAFIAALKLHYPGRSFDDNQYADIPPVVPWNPKLRIVISNPDVAHYKADQSHTVPRPITLPTTPFRYAA